MVWCIRFSPVEVPLPVARPNFTIQPTNLLFLFSLSKGGRSADKRPTAADFETPEDFIQFLFDEHARAAEGGGKAAGAAPQPKTKKKKKKK